MSTSDLSVVGLAAGTNAVLTLGLLRFLVCGFSLSHAGSSGGLGGDCVFWWSYVR